MGGITGIEQLNHPGWVGLDRYERELMYGLADPAHEADLRRIRVESILIDLLNTDPYLKEKSPEEVIDAMNEILEVNPDLHKNKPMLRVALRQFLESGGMDIPTLGVISEYGKDERQRKSQERSQAVSNAIQYANQAEQIRDSQRTREQQFLQAELERQSDEEIARLDRELREAEGERGRRHTTQENELNRLHQLALTATTLDSQERIARKQRELQREEGRENRDSSKSIAREQRALQQSEGEKNRESAERIAKKMRKLQRNEGEENREHQSQENELNRMHQLALTGVTLEAQDEIAKANILAQKYEGRENRKNQADIAANSVNEQHTQGELNRRLQAQLEEERMNSQLELEKQRAEVQRLLKMLEHQNEREVRQTENDYNVQQENLKHQHAIEQLVAREALKRPEPVPAMPDLGDLNDKARNFYEELYRSTHPTPSSRMNPMPNQTPENYYTQRTGFTWPNSNVTQKETLRTQKGSPTGSREQNNSADNQWDSNWRNSMNQFEAMKKKKRFTSKPRRRTTAGSV